MKNKIFLFSAIAVLVIFFSCNNASTSKDETATTSKDSSITAHVDNTGDWKIGVQLWTFRLFTQSEAIAKADSAGVRYIEAFLGQPFDKTSKEIDDTAEVQGKTTQHSNSSYGCNNT